MPLKKIHSLCSILFITNTGNKSTNWHLFLLRALTVIGIILLLLGYNTATQNPPSIDDAVISKGTLLKVTNPAHRGRFRTITIESKMGLINFRTYAIKKTAFLKNNLGKTITIWSYPSRDVLFINKNRVIEIKIDDSTILNNWDVVKGRIENSKPIGSILLIIGVALTLFTLSIIYKLATKTHH